MRVLIIVPVGPKSSAIATLADDKADSALNETFVKGRFLGGLLNDDTLQGAACFAVFAPWW
jgi:hypothetical protein